MRFFATFISLILAQSAFASNYEHLVEKYPAETASVDNCREQAREMASQFADAAEVERATGLCRQVYEAAYDIVIRYEAEERVAITSTDKAGFGIGQAGFFETAEECNAILAAETEVFASETSTTLIYEPYCLHMGGTGNDMPWMFKIEGVGESANRPYFESAVLFGQVLGHSRESFLAATMEGLRNLGLNPRTIRHQASLGYGYVTVLLYADRNVRINTGVFAKLDDVELCEAELVRFNNTLEGRNTVQSFCAAQRVSGHAEVTGMWLDEDPFGIEISLDRFEEYEQCTAARSAVVARYIEDGLEVVEGLCGLDDDGNWAVNLLVE